MMDEAIATLRTNARNIGTAGSHLRTRAKSIDRHVANTPLPPRSGRVARTGVAAATHAATLCAEQLTAFRRALTSHADKVDEVRAKIARVESVLRPKLEAAHALTKRVVEVHTEIQAAAFNPWMRVLPGPAGLVANQLTVKYFEDRGIITDPRSVERARSIAAVIQQIPPPGTPVWLTVAKTFTRWGW